MLHAPKQSNRIIDINTLREECPAAFATAPCSRVSKKYSFLPSSEIIEKLDDYGFKPVSFNQPKAKENGKTGRLVPSSTGAHLIDFEMPNGFEIKGEGKLRVTLFNSSDRSRRFTLAAGFFRWVCENGLIAGIKTDMVQRVHVKGQSEDVFDRIEEVIDHAGRLEQSVQAMSSQELKVKQVEAFAQEALRIKYANAASPITTGQALATRRSEDEGNTIWNVFNRVQENLVRGGIRSEETGRQTVEVGSPKLLFKLNTRLWDLAESYVN
jgi:hypothetical protein